MSVEGQRPRVRKRTLPPAGEPPSAEGKFPFFSLEAQANRRSKNGITCYTVLTTVFFSAIIIASAKLLAEKNFLNGGLRQWKLPKSDV